MEKKLAIIGASYLQRPLVEKANEMGIYTICFSWEDGAVCKDICDKFYPISIIDKESILKICLKEKINGVLSIASDVAVSTVNYVANKMKLTSNSLRSSLLSTNKYEMRNAFQQNNLLVPSFKIITNVQPVYKLDNLNFPIIVKPVDRSGSKGITIANNMDELKKAITNALQQSFMKNAIIEEFITGAEISVEAISWKGEHYILTYTDKITSGYPHFVELEHHQPSVIVNSKNKTEINYVVKKGLNALNIKNGASHSELIINSNGNIYITEIGARMGGDFIGSDLVQLSTGYDFLKGIIEIALDKFEPPHIERNLCSGVYFYSKQTKNILEWIVQKEDNRIKKSELLNNNILYVSESSERSGYFIYQAKEKLVI